MEISDNNDCVNRRTITYSLGVETESFQYHHEYRLYTLGNSARLYCIFCGDRIRYGDS